MNSRSFLTVGIALLLSAAAWAQQPNQIPVVGVLMVTVGPNDGPALALRKGLRNLGYIEGQNIR
ncbi:MAG TPA: hypothetical protein VGJ22_06370, partial [Anaerolineales bacterium]